MIHKWMGVIVVIGVIVAGALPPSALAQDDVTWLLNQINTLRASQGLYPYTLNPALSAAATQQSDYLAQTCDIRHTWPDGTTPAARAYARGYTGDHVIENIYAGSIATAADAWNFWLNSPIHYSGLVNTVVNEVGIGIAHGGLCGHAYTLVFGRGGGGMVPPPVGGNAVAAALPPTPVPYMPPPPTRTPTPTIPTLTPSATWTRTPTHIPTATRTPRLPTLTPLVLPTVPALGQPTGAIVVAQAISPTASEEPAVAPSRTAIPPSPTAVMPSPTAALALASPPAPDGGITARDLIPFALVAQVALIGLAGFAYFRRGR